MAGLTAIIIITGLGAHATDLAALDPSQFIEQAAVRIQRAFHLFNRRQRSSCPGIVVARPQPPTVRIQPEDEGDSDTLADQEIPGPPPSGRDPDSESRSRPNRETGIPCFPILAESGIGVPFSRFLPNRESGIPSPIPGQIGNRGNGNWGFGPKPTELATGHWQPLTGKLLTCVGGNQHFRGSKAAFGPRIVLGTHMG